jgi:hypothetical protein
LIALLTAFLLIHFGSHSSALTSQLDQTAALIQKDVVDDHRKQALAIIEQMKAEAKAYAKRRQKSVDALNSVLGKRTTPVSEIGAPHNPRSPTTALCRKALDLRFQLNCADSSEWEKVFPAPPDTTGKKRSA